MLQRMEAQILFHDPNDVSEGSAALIEQGFDVEVLDDLIDPCGPTTWIRARTTSDLAEGHFFDWVQSIVEPLGGWIEEAGRVDAPPASSWWHYDDATHQWQQSFRH
jgi:hypothetical protein